MFWTLQNLKFQTKPLITHNDNRCPWIPKYRGHDQEAGCKHDGDGDEEVMPQPDILFPEREGDTAGVAGKTFLRELVTDRAHLLQKHPQTGLVESTFYPAKDGWWWCVCVGGGGGGFVSSKNRIAILFPPKLLNQNLNDSVI